MLEDLLANDYKLSGLVLIALAAVTRQILCGYKRMWLGAVLSLGAVVGVGLIIAGMSPPA